MTAADDCLENVIDIKIKCSHWVSSVHTKIDQQIILLSTAAPGNRILFNCPNLSLSQVLMTIDNLDKYLKL